MGPFRLSLSVAQARLLITGLGAGLLLSLVLDAPVALPAFLGVALAAVALAIPSLRGQGGLDEGLRALADHVGRLARNEPADSPADLPAPVRAVDEAITNLAADLRERSRQADASADRFRTLADRLPALVWIVEEDGDLVYQNQHARLFAADRALADPAARLALIHPADREILSEARGAAIERQGEYTVEVRLRRADGVYLWHQLTAVPIDLGEGGERTGRGWLTCGIEIGNRKEAEAMQVQFAAELERRVVDATERLNEETGVRQKAERRLRQTQRMEAISRLTGGIAHDLNNKLMVMNANIDSVTKQLKDQPNLRRKLLAALVASDQAAALLSKLLTFARQRELQPQYIEIGQHLDSIGSLLERSFVSDGVTVSFDIPEDLWAVEVDPHELETAIVNLGVNARDAMAQGGTVAIEARNAHVRPGTLSDPDIAGDFVAIEIRDTGVGIAPDALEHVFEPFFTTKGASRASGLGLSQVHGFVKQLGGTVEIASAPGEGTSVTLYLPRAALPTLAGARDTAVDILDDDDVPRPQGEVLVVDDEVEVAFALQGLLQETGYKVRIAIGVDEAMEAIAARRPQLVLTDVTMPGAMDGVALAREIRRAHPTLPVVLITGNPMVVAEESEFPLLSKPISSRDLHAALQRQLTAPADSNVVTLFTPGRKTSS